MNENYDIPKSNSLDSMEGLDSKLNDVDNGGVEESDRKKVFSSKIEKLRKSLEDDLMKARSTPKEGGQYLEMLERRLNEVLSLDTEDLAFQKEALPFEFSEEVINVTYSEASSRLQDLNISMGENETQWRIPTEEDWKIVIKPLLDAKQKDISHAGQDIILQQIIQDRNLSEDDGRGSFIFFENRDGVVGYFTMDEGIMYKLNKTSANNWRGNAVFVR